MRRLVVALLVAALASTLVGCGGGGEQAATPEEPAAPAAAPPAPVSGEAVSDPIADRSLAEPDVFAPFPTGEFVPKDILGRLESKQPMLLFFYDPQQQTSDDTRAEIDAVVAQNRGLIDLLSYDLGKYTSIDSSGVAQVDPKLAESDSGTQSIQLAQSLGVTFLPYIVIVDDQGYVIFKSRGPLDSELIERQVQRATR